MSDCSGYRFIRSECRGKVLTLTLDHAPVNTVHFERHNELSRIFCDVQVDHAAEVIVLTGDSSSAERADASALISFSAA